MEVNRLQKGNYIYYKGRVVRVLRVVTGVAEEVRVIDQKGNIMVCRNRDELTWINVTEKLLRYYGCVKIGDNYVVKTYYKNYEFVKKGDTYQLGDYIDTVDAVQRFMRMINNMRFKCDRLPEEKLL